MKVSTLLTEVCAQTPLAEVYVTAGHSPRERAPAGRFCLHEGRTSRAAPPLTRGGRVLVSLCAIIALMGGESAIRSRSARRPREAARQLLRPDDWVAAAQAELVKSGVSAVTVGRLARRLKVTRGSFYWHFKNHGDLLRALLKFWEEANTGSFERALASSNGGDGVSEFLAIVNLLLAEKEYSPAFDLAVRDWARTSREAATAVRRADERRMQVLHRTFLDMGFADPEALVRARVTYFQQIGYYTLGIHEDPEARRKLLPYYLRVLVGKSIEEMVSTPAAS